MGRRVQRGVHRLAPRPGRLAERSTASAELHSQRATTDRLSYDLDELIAAKEVRRSAAIGGEHFGDGG
jgi:hypothetical protein